MHMQTLALHGKIENTSIIRHLSSKYHIMRISKHGHFRIFMRHDDKKRYEDKKHSD